MIDYFYEIIEAYWKGASTFKVSELDSCMLGGDGHFDDVNNTHCY